MSCSGDRHCALAETVGPVVVTQCVTLCLMYLVVTLGWVTAGNTETIVSKGLDGLGGSSDGLRDVTVDTFLCKVQQSANWSWHL